MTAPDASVLLERFEAPDEIRLMPKGRLELVRTAAFDYGRVVELRAGELFCIPAVPHDSWVVGGEPSVSLHFLGADDYAR
jgi:hypothetical protein